MGAKSTLPSLLIALIVAQSACAAIFLVDIIADYRVVAATRSLSMHFSIEALTTLLLLLSVVVEAFLLRYLMRRTIALQHGLRQAQSALYDVIHHQFAQWDLTGAEHEVALLLIKGVNTAEIAALRNCAEGTVKAHLSAIYRKSGARNRAEVMALLIDEIMGRESTR